MVISEITTSLILSVGGRHNPATHERYLVLLERYWDVRGEITIYTTIKGTQLVLTVVAFLP